MSLNRKKPIAKKNAPVPSRVASRCTRWRFCWTFSGVSGLPGSLGGKSSLTTPLGRQDQSEVDQRRARARENGWSRLYILQVRLTKPTDVLQVIMDYFSLRQCIVHVPVRLESHVIRTRSKKESVVGTISDDIQKTLSSVCEIKNYRRK